ncbi:DGC domain protein [uncultured Desulfobacterium sp.]|uniref:DGC domain protein n=1 Tax=uncultured Desulfobacterium sp. TaxID=201089 RepID=A0A445N3U2_9BACT|nr:DGC domain protein [uncultured Desulfobacterium sp.]
MSIKKNDVVVLPCSGIGKAYGTLARETAYELVERVRPGLAKLTCLPLLVINDPQAKQLVMNNPVITIDGCPKGCAHKSVESVGAQVAKAYQAIDFYKAHKELKPDGITELNDAGRRLAAVAAEELSQVVDALAAGEEG